MKEKIYLGIDGGGTKTGFSIIDSQGNLLGKSIKPTIHLKQVDRRGFIDRINDGIQDALKNTSYDKKDIEYVFAGVPAYGEYKDLIEDVHDRMREILGHERFTCGNDCVAGWAGSQAVKPGVNMVLGTGAIAYGRDYKGNEERASGWGPFCGDEGSAYWLGKKLIEIFCKQSDGRYDKGPLYNIVRDKFEIKNDFDLISIVSIEMAEDRTKIAKLAKLLSEAASMGDEAACRVIDRVAYEVYISIMAVVKKLSFEEDENIYVSYSGGVFSMGSILTKKIAILLEEDKRIKIIDSILGPDEGAALMAYMLSGNKVSEDVIENLRRS